MSTYREQLARREKIRASLPKREFLTKAEFRQLKSALTRACNSGDGEKILATVEKAVSRFDECIWPDDWARWMIALQDAAYAELAKGNLALADELHAASLILFR
jgi:hypothetical protein